MRSLFRRLLWILAALCLLGGAVIGQQDQQDTYLDPSLPQGVTVRDIISRFAAQEEIFKQAYDRYTYRQIVRMQTLNDQDFPDGEYDETFDVTFNNQGQRVVKEVSRPRDTLKRIRVTSEDIDDIRNRLPFVLTTDDIPIYNIRYKGQQDTAGTHCYVFDISPKAMEDNRRYFEGRIWVDARDYQVVKSSGKAVPDIYNQNGENLFPSFTTYRELVDGKYWFPSYTKSDDYLHFSQETVHVIETVDYTNYKRFGAESKIIFDGQEIGSSQQQQPTQQPGGRQYPNQQNNVAGYSGIGSNTQERGYPAQQQPQPAPAQRTQPQPVNPPQQPIQYVQQALMSLENEISDAITNKQVSILERILTDDYHLISANGDSEDKFGLLDDVHQNRAGRFGQPQNMQVQVNGDRATVIGVREESVPVSGNKMQSARVRFADSFVRRAGEWFLMQTKEAPAR